MLSLQNPDGGFASYEVIRAPLWMEYLNPAEVFGEHLSPHARASASRIYSRVSILDGQATS